MTNRQDIIERIDQLDEAGLSFIEAQLDMLEQREGKGFSKKFTDTLDAVHERNKDLSGEEALKIATEAVKAHRQERRH